jgi:hypothetical protein
MELMTIRDLSVVSLGEVYMVVACDSCGGIGLKEYDVVQLTPDKIAYITMNVICCELASLRIKPSVIINNVCAEMDDTGKKVIEGINEYMKDYFLDMDFILTGSTEENFKTVQTGIGLSVIGYKNRDEFFLPSSNARDLVAVIGKPKVGQEVIDDRGEILNSKELWNLLELNCINEVIPAGSKGLGFEIGQLNIDDESEVLIYDNLKIDLNKSAGPATCAVVTLSKDKVDEFKEGLSIPYEIIGEIK